MLNGDDAPGGEAAAVADAVNLVDDGDCGVASAQEIGMERMGEALLHRAARRDQRLADHLPAEHALPADLRAQAPEQINLERLDVEDREQLFQCAAHGPSLLPKLTCAL